MGDQQAGVSGETSGKVSTEQPSFKSGESAKTPYSCNLLTSGLLTWIHLPEHLPPRHQPPHPGTPWLQCSSHTPFFNATHTSHQTPRQHNCWIHGQEGIIIPGSIRATINPKDISPNHFNEGRVGKIPDPRLTVTRDQIRCKVIYPNRKTPGQPLTACLKTLGWIQGDQLVQVLKANMITNIINLKLIL